MAKQTDVLFVSHGGGPLPLMGDPGHQQLLATLQTIRSQLRQPDAVVLISAHWEQSLPTLTAAADPGLLYDYFGFAPESYEIKYPCAGEPELATQLYQTFAGAGMPARLDERRSFDHGMFVPMKLLFPQADIPCVQLSLLNSLDAGQHLQMGEVLRELDYDNLLVIGSGFSFHNMRAFFAPDSLDIREKNQAFEAWLTDTCSNQSLSETQRRQRFVDWQQAPHARFCHPREEHLLPLHVCYGLAQRACDAHWSVEVLGRQSGMFYWQLED